MNLFVAGWNFERANQDFALECLSSMTEHFPQLDQSTARHRFNPFAHDPNRGILLAGIESESPIRKHHCSNRALDLLYSGAPASTRPGVACHEAAHLARMEDAEIYALEGQFIIVRVRRDADCMEVITDPVGIYPAYQTDHDGVWLVSNNARLLSRLTKRRALCRVGVSLTLAMGWAGGESTLQARVKTLECGHHRRTSGSPCVEHTRYWRLESLRQRRRRPMSRSDAEHLSSKLSNVCRSFLAGQDRAVAHLSGGLDTRVVSALLGELGCQVDYETLGCPESDDVRLAIDYAKKKSLRHSLVPSETRDVVADWSEASWRIVDQTDGLAGLWQVPEVIGQRPESEPGMGILGGLASPVHPLYMDRYHMVYGRDRGFVQSQFERRFAKDHSGLMLAPALECTKSFIDRFIDRWIDRGFSAYEIPEVFFAIERNGRWAGANLRKYLPAGDVLLPLAAPSTLEHAFRISGILHHSRQLHYRLLERLSPNDIHIPHNQPWKSQTRAGAWGSLLKSMLMEKLCPQKTPGAYKDNGLFNRAEWIRRLSTTIADVVFARKDSMVWEFASRARAEECLRPGVDDSDLRRSINGLFSLITVRYFEETLLRDRCASN